MAQSKQDQIDEVKANLPLPEEPPKASDWQSADARTVNVGAGSVDAKMGTEAASQAGLREPATKGDNMDMSSIGREAKDKQ